jgi:hypothetical protein
VELKNIRRYQIKENEEDAIIAKVTAKHNTIVETAKNGYV